MVAPFITVSGDREVAIRLEKMPAVIQKHLLRAIKKSTSELFNRVQPPRGKTGRLASQKYMKVTEGDDFIRGIVTIRGQTGNDFAKAAALEWGVKRASRHDFVREHKRRHDHVWRRAIEPMEVIVDRYNRSQTIDARRFLRGPFEAMRSEIEKDLTAAAEAGAAEAMAE